MISRPLTLHQLNGAIKRIGATKTIDRYPFEGESMTTLDVWAPAGHQWVATCCRVITAQYFTHDRSDKETALQTLLDDLAAGVEPYGDG